MAQISVRPNRVKLLKALKVALERIEKAADKYEADRAKYKEDIKVWRESADLSPSNIKSTEIIIGSREFNRKTQKWVSGPSRVEVVLKKYPSAMPVEPDAPNTGTKDSYTYREAVVDLTGVIKLLEIVDDEVVNASVANKVAKYL